MRTRPITITEVEYTAYRLATELMTWNAPIPSFDSRLPGMLESCLGAPFQTFQRKHLYRGLVGKAAILFYLMNKNHPFQNGNKRIAVMTLLLFLHNNKKWLRMNNKRLYRFARHVSASKPRGKEIIVEEIREVVKQHLIRI